MHSLYIHPQPFYTHIYIHLQGNAIQKGVKRITHPTIIYTVTQAI